MKKNSISKRTSPLFVQEILCAFNAGLLDAGTAAERLMIKPAGFMSCVTSG